MTFCTEIVIKEKQNLRFLLLVECDQSVLSRLNKIKLGWSWDVMAKLKIIQNEKLIEL